MDIFERIGQFFKAHPRYFGIILIGFGVLMFLAALKNWEWFFRGYSHNTKKLEGLSNMWGRGLARLVAGIGGISCIIFGIIWFAIYVFYYNQ